MANSRPANIRPAADISPQIAPLNVRRKNVSVACTACRQNRSKCSGESPCRLCVSANIECLYETSQDGRRKETRKRKVQELENDSQLLTNLIETIQNSGDIEVAQIVSLIRNNAPVSEVKICIQQQISEAGRNQRASSPDLALLHHRIETLRPDSTEGEKSIPRHPRRTMDISRLTDSPPHKVPAKPWTTITDDDTLVSNLVSVLLTWDKPFHNFFDQTAFLRDMRKGELNSKYCSPFLVNALLGFACSYSDYDDARPSRGAASKLMVDFMENAKRLLIEEEMDGSPITKASGLALLCLCFCALGQDKVGHDYIEQASVVCKELENSENSRKDRTTLSEKELSIENAIDILCWGIFNLVVLRDLTWQMAPTFLPPNRPLPQPDEDNLEWTPYPLPGAAVLSHANEWLYQESMLSPVSRDIADLLYQQLAVPMERAELEKGIVFLYDRLKKWFDALPDHLTLMEDSAPSTLTHIAYYLSQVVALFAPLKQDAEGASPQLTERARDLSVSAALEISHIIDIHQSLYGNSHMSVYIQQPVIVALETLLDEPDSSPYHADIFSLCVFFRAISRRWPFALAALRMFQVTTRQRKKRLPKEINKLFQEFERKDWRERELKELVSAYPVIGDREDGRAERRNLTDFYDMMDRLQVENSPDEM